MERKKQDFDKYTISGLWVTMCGYIVLMFVREVLTNNYLIHLYVDSLVAVFAFYITLHNIYSQYQMLKSYQMTLKPFAFQLFGFFTAFLVVLVTLKSPFEFSFLILVITYLKNKDMVKKELKL